MAKKSTPPQNEKKPSFITNLKISRVTALEIAALGVILAVAIILRVLPLQWGPYLNEYDPFFWYRVTEHIAKNGFASYFTWHDTLSWYPVGRDIRLSSLPGNPFTAAAIWVFLNTIGVQVSVLQVTLFFPILFACLTCIAAYYFGKDLGGKAVGILTSAMLAISPSYISRTVLGFFDTENIGILGMVCTGLFFMRSLEPEKPLNKRILYAGAAGLSMAYAFSAWAAARYIVGLLTLFVALTFVIGKVEQRHIISYSISMAVGFIIAAFIPRLGINFLLNIENLAVAGLVGIMVVYELVKTKLEESQARMASLGLVVLGLIAVFLLPSFGIGIPITGKFLKVINPFAEANPLFTSVGEHRLSIWASYFGDYGASIILAIVGCFFLLREEGERRVFSILFFLTALYFAGTLVRLLLILAFPASLMAAYGLVRIIQPFTSVKLRQPEFKGKRRRGEIFAVNRWISIFFVGLLFLSFIPHITVGTIQTANSPGPLASSGVPVLFDGKYATDWVDALNWLKANTTTDSIVCSWWDYGYWIQTMANRTTLADGSTSDTGQIIKLANIMMKPHNESLPLLESFDADYIVVFVTFNPNSPIENRTATYYEEMSWPLGDNAKWGRMAEIAGYNMTNFFIQDTTTGQIFYTELYTNSTIARLMYKTADPAHFELVFESNFGFVKVYKIEY